MIKVGLRSGGVIRIDGKTVDASELQLSDIAYGLGSLQRFGGQLDRWYSVAEHSVILSEIEDNHLDYGKRIAALFHDAAECLGCGDVNAFLKAKEAAKIENQILSAVLTRFDVAPYADKALDRWLGNWEATHITPAKRHWEPPAPRANMPTFRHWNPQAAAENWLAKYYFYLTSAKFLTNNDLPAVLATLKPGVPFDKWAVARRYPDVDPVAVFHVLSQHAKEIGDGKYAV